jgi:predicted aspartyl protease
MTKEQADELFKQGKFEDAGREYEKMLSQDSDNYEATLQLGKIALYSNKFNEAEDLLKKAMSLKTDKKETILQLVEVYYRQDKFIEAASILKKIGSKKAKRFESFKDIKPNKIVGDKEITKIEFIQTDPLPVLQVTINKREKVDFIIDTGGHEIVIDSEYAKEVGVDFFNSSEGVFAGGKKAQVESGVIKSIDLGEFTIENVPVSIMPVRQFTAPVFGGKQINGILGTALFYHFITTVDYVNGELVLRKKTDENMLIIDELSRSLQTSEIPFWLAGTHFIVAWGKVNKSKPMLFFVDTGLAGGGFTCPESTIKKAGIELLHDQARTGSGGGGKIQVIPFIVNELSLGNITEKNIQGFFAGGKSLSEMVGFHIGGIISHAFFRNYALTFDFTNMRLVLEKKSE